MEDFHVWIGSGSVGLLSVSERLDYFLLNIVFLFLFQANSTFTTLATLKELADSWDELGPRVWDFLQDSPQVNALRVRLCTKKHDNKRTGFIAGHVFNFLIFRYSQTFRAADRLYFTRSNL